MKVRDTTALLTAVFTASLLCQTSGVEESSDNLLVWIEGHNSVSTDAGSSLELTCHAKVTDAVTNILWVKVNDDGSIIISHDERLLIDSDRISINFNSSEGTSLLKITNTNSKDSGRYECQMPTMNSTFSAAVEVVVKEDTDETSENTSAESNLPTNTSISDEEDSLSSKGHSITYSVFLIPSVVYTCVLFNAIPLLKLL